MISVKRGMSSRDRGTTSVWDPTNENTMLVPIDDAPTTFDQRSATKSTNPGKSSRLAWQNTKLSRTDRCLHSSSMPRTVDANVRAQPVIASESAAVEP
jgi:hypothetical protein